MAKKKYEHIDLNYVIEQYTTNKKNSVELSKELGVSDWWIRDRLSKKGIQVRPQGGGQATINLIGEKFGKYTVLEKINRPGITQCARWKVRCECGNEKEVYSKALRLGQATSCGFCNGVSNKWKGIGDLSGTHFNQIKNNAEVRSLQFEVDMEYLWNLFLEQNGKCKLSGMELSLKRKNSKGEKIERTASLDRIDSTQGYIVGNVQWVHKVINQLKWSYDQKFFIDICKKIAENN